MKTKIAILFILAAAGTLFAATYINRKKRNKKMLESVSDEGYETAPDILFPGEKGGAKLKYGPVVPH